MTSVLSVLFASALTLGAEPPPVEVCDPAVAEYALAIYVCVTDPAGTTRLPAAARLCRLDSGAAMNLHNDSGPSFKVCVARAAYSLTVTYPGYSEFSVTVPAFVREFSMHVRLEPKSTKPPSFNSAPDTRAGTSLRGPLFAFPGVAPSPR